MPLLSLTASLRTWRQNPIAPLNHWYSCKLITFSFNIIIVPLFDFNHISVADDWIKVLPSAVAFLTGEGQTPDDFVPYLQYKPTTQVSIFY